MYKFTASSVSSIGAPEVMLPGRDIFIPRPEPTVSIIRLKREGEPCGSCNCPPTFTAGKCLPGLECVHDKWIADAPGKCMKPGKYNNSELIL